MALCTLLVANAATAMGISPVLVDLSPRQRVVSVTLTNPSAQAITYQAQTLSWRQYDAADDYLDTGDLLVSPAIARISAGQSQVFRVVLRGAPPAQTEKAYRLILDDITEETERAQGEAMVQMVLRFNLPVFSAPLAAPRAAARWSQCTAAPGEACLRLDNDGNRRIRIAALNVAGPGWQQKLAGSATVLAGAWHQWTFAHAPAQGLPWRVTARSEAGLLKADVVGAPR